VSACGEEIIRTDEDSVWLKLAGMTAIFREVEGYQPPMWPSSDVPMQGWSVPSSAKYAAP
jgi:hypothetical protein